MESETAILNEADLDVIHPLKICLKSYLTEKGKQFQTGFIKNHFNE